MLITIVRAVQTCMACPSQWDLWDDQDNYYYARYRHGCGEVRRYQTAHWYHSDDDQYIDTIAEFSHGDPLDGSISLEEFAEHAGIELARDACVTGYGDFLRDELVTLGIIRLIDQ